MHIGLRGIGLDQPRGSARTGPAISLTNNVVAENTAAGTTIGTLSVTNGSGVYVLALTDTAGNRFALTGSTLKTGATNIDYEAATSYDITVTADNGVDPLITRTITMYVTDVAEGGSSLLVGPMLIAAA